MEAIEATLLQKSYPDKLWFVGELVGESFSPKVRHSVVSGFHGSLYLRKRGSLLEMRRLLYDDAVLCSAGEPETSSRHAFPLLDILAARFFRGLAWRGSRESF